MPFGQALYYWPCFVRAGYLAHPRWHGLCIAGDVHGSRAPLDPVTVSFHGSNGRVPIGRGQAMVIYFLALISIIVACTFFTVIVFTSLARPTTRASKLATGHAFPRVR